MSRPSLTQKPGNSSPASSRGIIKMAGTSALSLRGAGALLFKAGSKVQRSHTCGTVSLTAEEESNALTYGFRKHGSSVPVLQA